MFRFLIAIFLLAFSGCSIFEKRETVARKDIKDVNFLQTKADSQPKRRLMVLPLLDFDPTRPEDLKEKIRQGFIGELNRGSDLIAFDSSELKLDLSKTIKNNEYDMKEISKEAYQLGVTSLLEAKVLDVRLKRKSDQVGVVRNMNTTFEVITRVRVFNTRTGKEAFNTVKTVTHEQDDVRIAQRVKDDRNFLNNPEVVEVLIKDALFDFASSIHEGMAKVSWEGRIAAIQGDRIYLNVGKISGIQVGDLLKVTEPGDDIYDAEAGYHLGRVPGRAKGTLEVVSFFGHDGSIAILHSGGGFKENDKVEVYQ